MKAAIILLWLALTACASPTAPPYHPLPTCVLHQSPDGTIYDTCQTP